MFSAREKRFLRYASVGVSTFGIDLALLWTLAGYGRLHYVVATPIAFFVALSLNFFLSRRFAFRESDRDMVSGYGLFLGFAGIGMASTTLLMWVLVECAAWNVVIARVGVAGAVGMGNYLANLYLTFRVAGKHSEE